MTPKTMQTIRHDAVMTIKKLKIVNRELTAQGCLNAHVHFKKKRNRRGAMKKTDVMYLREAMNKKTRKRQYHHIGSDPDDQKKACESIARFKRREELRKTIAYLKHCVREVDNMLKATEAAFNSLKHLARKACAQYAPHL